MSSREKEIIGEDVGFSSIDLFSDRIESIENSSENDSPLGCCHQSVEEIALRLFSRESFKHLISQRIQKEKIQKWKKNLTSFVSLECVKEKMEEKKIQSFLFGLITREFFDYLF